MTFPAVRNMLARAFASGEAGAKAAAERGKRLLGERWRWVNTLAVRYCAAFPDDARPRIADVVQFIHRDAGFRNAWKRYRSDLSVSNWFVDAPRMRPVRAAASWNVEQIETVGDLGAWLGLDSCELEWFGSFNRFVRQPSNSRLVHYHFRILNKPCGSVRLIEAPKPRLKELQRKILSGILERVPAHPSVHGFVKGRSIRTFASSHAGQRVVLKMDLTDFFPSIRLARIQAFFRTAGYPEPVANLLGGICTVATPRSVFRSLAAPERQGACDLYCSTHLPQGAPTSPALANLCAYRLDCRLDGFASSIGARYSRYADDLVFSGDENFEHSVERLPPYIAAIAHEEGFRVNHRKTRVMRRSVRQQITGIVVNDKVNIRRSDYDQLKAILTNCVRLGPATQNRAGHPQFRAHLQGRVAFVGSIHPGHGATLRSIFDRIDWSFMVE